MPTVQDSLEWITTSGQSKLFATTEGGKLYSSKNSGASWYDDTPDLMTKDGMKSSDKVLAIITSGEDESNMIVQGFDGEHWASRDLGKNWIQPCGVVGVDPNDCFADPGNGRLCLPSSRGYRLPDHVLVLVERDLEPESGSSPST